MITQLSTQIFGTKAKYLKQSNVIWVVWSASNIRNFPNSLFCSTSHATTKRFFLFQTLSIFLWERAMNGTKVHTCNVLLRQWTTL